jgi:hypothetical protein
MLDGLEQLASAQAEVAHGALVHAAPTRISADTESQYRPVGQPTGSCLVPGIIGPRSMV